MNSEHEADTHSYRQPANTLLCSRSLFSYLIFYFRKINKINFCQFSYLNERRPSGNAIMHASHILRVAHYCSNLVVHNFLSASKLNETNKQQTKKEKKENIAQLASCMGRLCILNNVLWVHWFTWVNLCSIKLWFIKCITSVQSCMNVEQCTLDAMQPLFIKPKRTQAIGVRCSFV